MTVPVTLPAPGAAELLAAAAAAGLTATAAACWPETGAEDTVAPLAGFIESAFSPLIAEVAGRALQRRLRSRADQDRVPPDGGETAASGPGPVTAIVLVTSLGDLTSAARVAAAVDAGRRVAPLLFFQSVPNAVAGYLAARWHLTGPVVCVSGTGAGVDAAALLLRDADADEVLLVRADLGMAGAGDRAAALLVTGPTGWPAS